MSTPTTNGMDELRPTCARSATVGNWIERLACAGDTSASARTALATGSVRSTGAVLPTGGRSYARGARRNARLSAHGNSDLERGARRAPYPHTLGALAKALQLAPAERSTLEASTRVTRRPPRVTRPGARGALPTVVGLPSLLTRLVGRKDELAAFDQPAPSEPAAGYAGWTWWRRQNTTG
jgi:hypothetical protein